MGPRLLVIYIVLCLPDRSKEETSIICFQFLATAPPLCLCLKAIKPNCFWWSMTQLMLRQAIEIITTHLAQRGFLRKISHYLSITVKSLEYQDEYRALEHFCESGLCHSFSVAEKRLKCGKKWHFCATWNLYTVSKCQKVARLCHLQHVHSVKVSTRTNVLELGPRD